MQLNAIETFLAIDRSGSFHAAAAQLNVTQTAVSARIKALEAGLATTLFERGPGGTRLSAAGRQFKPYAEQMLRTWEFVRSDLSGPAIGRVSLRLGSQLSIWDPLLVDVAIWLEKEHDKVPFVLNYDHNLNMAEAVSQQLLDLAIVNDVPAGTRLEVEDLPPEEMIAVSDGPLDLGKGDPPLFINLELGPEYDTHIRANLPGSIQQHIVLGNAQMGLKYLLRRGGFGYFPASLVVRPINRGRLSRVKGAPDLQISCKALYSKDNPAINQIREVLKGLRKQRSN
ncbi:MAG: LysR family transcriptional regulator [Paracoccaceae bacterium]